METTHNLDALAKALVEAARNLRTAKLDSERVKDAARDVEAAIATATAVPGPTTDGDADEDTRRALAPIGALAGEVAETVTKINATLQKLGEDLLRAAQTLGQ